MPWNMHLAWEWMKGSAVSLVKVIHGTSWISKADGANVTSVTTNKHLQAILISPSNQSHGGLCQWKKKLTERYVVEGWEWECCTEKPLVLFQWPFLALTKQGWCLCDVLQHQLRLLHDPLFRCGSDMSVNLSLWTHTGGVRERVCSAGISAAGMDIMLPMKKTPVPVWVPEHFYIKGGSRPIQ